MEFESSTWGDTPFISPSDVILIKRVNEGSFGIVFKAIYMYQIVAVKVFRPQNNTGYLGSCQTAPGSGGTSLIIQMEQEVRILRNLRHNNVVGFLGAVKEPPAIVMDYCESGSLWDVLRRAETNEKIWRRLSWTRRMNLLLGAAKGMAFVHAHLGTKPPILHRDLKSPNILLDKNWVVKIADFGLSRFVSSNLNSLWDTMGTNPTWMAPEAIKHLSDCSHEFTQSADVYPMGIIMWELMTLKRPWYADSIPPIPGKILHWVVHKNFRPPIPEDPYALPGVRQRHNALNEYIKLMTECWSTDPSMRPTYEIIVCRLQHIKDLFMGRPAPCLNRVETNEKLKDLLNLMRFKKKEFEGLRTATMQDSVSLTESLLQNVLGNSGDNSHAQEKISFLSFDGPVEKDVDIRPAYEKKQRNDNDVENEDTPSQNAQPLTQVPEKIPVSGDSIPGFESPFAATPVYVHLPDDRHTQADRQEDLQNSNSSDSDIPFPSAFAN